MGVSLNVRFPANHLQQDLLNLAVWCTKWRIKLNLKKPKVIISSRSVLARKTEPNLKLYGETLKVCPQVKFLGITFDSQLAFQKHFEDIVHRCNIRYNRLKLLVNQKWGPSLSTIIQIYRQCIQSIFRTTLFRRLPPRTTSSAKFNGSKINLFGLTSVYQNTFVLSYSITTGLPYVKDRLPSCAIKSLDRIAQKP